MTVLTIVQEVQQFNYFTLPLNKEALAQITNVMNDGHEYTEQEVKDSLMVTGSSPLKETVIDLLLEHPDYSRQKNGKIMNAYFTNEVDDEDEGEKEKTEDDNIIV